MYRFFFVCLIFLCVPVVAHASAFDLAIDEAGTSFSPANPQIGQQIKIYVAVTNVGSSDVEGTVVFNDGSTVIGRKALSVRANGKEEEAWVLWKTFAVGHHAIRIDVVNDDDNPDATPDNNATTLKIFVDGDMDGDGIPDASDSDRDNDGLTNTREKQLGTNPLKRDTDKDGVSDKQDAYPLDPKRTKEVAPVKTTIKEPAQVLSGDADQSVTGTTSAVAEPAVESSTGVESRIITTEISASGTRPATDSPLSMDRVLWTLAGSTLVLSGLFFTRSIRMKRE